MQALYSKTLEKHDDMERQLTKALGDLDSAQKESEYVKKVLQDAIDNAAKNLQEQEEAHEMAMKTCLEDAVTIVAHNQQEMQTELAKLNQHITKLEEDRAKVSCERDQLSESRDEVKRKHDEVKRDCDDLKKQIQELCDQNEELEAQAELNAAERNESENEVRKLRSVMSSLQTEVAEVKQQLTIAVSNKETLSDESLAKTQQVKQYKKQVDNFRTQLAERFAMIEQYQKKIQQYEYELTCYQRGLQARKKDRVSKGAVQALV